MDREGIEVEYKRMINIVLNNIFLYRITNLYPDKEWKERRSRSKIPL